MLWTYPPAILVFNTHVFSRLLSIEQNSEVLVYNGTHHKVLSVTNYDPPPLSIHILVNHHNFSNYSDCH